jgi:hypothetical protein
MHGRLRDKAKRACERQIGSLSRSFDSGSLERPEAQREWPLRPAGERLSEPSGFSALFREQLREPRPGDPTYFYALALVSTTGLIQAFPVAQQDALED